MMTRALIEGPSTIPEIAHDCGLSYVTVRRYINTLRKYKCIHVAAWDTDAGGRRTLRSYSIGERADAPRPPKRTHAQRQKLYRERARVVQQAMEALA